MTQTIPSDAPPKAGESRTTWGPSAPIEEVTLPIEEVTLEDPRQALEAALQAWVRGARGAPPAGAASVRPRVSVVMPTLNEAANLPFVSEGLTGVDELIVVDGDSSDDTVAVAKRLWPWARVIQQPRRGKGDALRAGFEAATGDIIVMLDGDGSTDPREIPRFVEALVGGADFVKGSRFASGGGSSDLTRLRRIGVRGLTGLVNLLFGTDYTDLCYGYNAFWRDCLDRLAITSCGFEIETLININLAKAGLSVAEVPSLEQSRLNGDSHLRTVRDGFRVLRTIVRERFRRRERQAHEARLPVEAEARLPVEAVG